VQQLDRRDDEEEVMIDQIGMWPPSEDGLARREGEPDGWHTRRLTDDGHPLMGSSPAEREEAADRGARIMRQAMRDHPFVGGGRYCEARISFAPMGSAETGTITGWAGCGYNRETHPVCACSERLDYDDEKIRTHCAEHCPRVLAGDWSECRGC
jgi:glutathione S-transferase